MKVRVILLEPEKSGNIGSVARAMKNFDLDDLWIVNPKTQINTEAGLARCEVFLFLNQ